MIDAATPAHPDDASRTHSREVALGHRRETTRTRPGDAPLLPPDDTPLVQVDWLAAHLDNPSLVVLDTRGRIVLPGSDEPAAKRAEFDAGHVPGAQFVAFDRDFVDTSAAVPNTLAGAEQFAARAGELGIGPHTLVVALDDDHAMFAARLWWAFRAMGHDAVRVLDGGLPAWSAAGHPVTADPTPPRVPARFVAAPRARLRATQADIAELVAGGTAGGATPPTTWVLDARSPARYRGEGTDAVGGHVPGAHNVPYSAVLDDTTGRFLPPLELRAVVRAAGLDPDAPPAHVVASCGSGISASVPLIALELAGIRPTSGEPAAVYDDSWAGWSRSGHAIATGAAPWGNDAAPD